MHDPGMVLVVEDEAPVREIIRRGLTERAIRCCTAASAEEALSVVQVEQPLVVMTDIRMPGRDGVWLLKQMKDRWPEVCVILLTAVEDARTAVECLRAGAEDYLTKPFDPDELAITVQKMIEVARLRREHGELRRNLDSLVKERTRQLSQTLKEVEKTYQTTLEALVRSHQSDGIGLSVGVASLSGAGSSGAEDPERDLAAIRAASELIGQGAAPVEVGRVVIGALVDQAGFPFARLWVPDRGGAGLQIAVEKGASPRGGSEPAEMAAARQKVQIDTQGEGGSVSAPILVRGRVEGVLQIGWSSGVAPAALGERLALFLAAAVRREREAEEWRKTARELDVFYNMASASRYTLDLEHIARFFMDSLHKIVDYEIAGLLLLDEPASLHVHTRFAASEELIEAVRAHILNTLRLTCGVEAGADLVTRVRRLGPDGGTRPPSHPERRRSFVNVPFTVGGAVAGLMHVSSSREHAFTQEDVRFLNRAASFIASSVQGVRELLAAVKGRVEKMVEHMTDGVLMLDRRGSVVAINEAARRILRIAPGETPVLRTADLSRIFDFDPLVTMENERRSVRRVIVLGGVPYQAQLTPVDDSEGELNGVVFAFRNFAEEKKIDEMKSEFINIVSHELRTPLTAIKNSLHLLLSPKLGELNGPQSHFLGLARRNCEQLIGMVNDLLDLSKIETGNMHVPLRPLDIGEPIETVVTSLRAQAEEKGVALEVGLGEDLPRIYGDPASLQRVLVNLVGNALKFTEAGGRVRVDAVAEIEESSGGRRPLVKVVVSDTGKGIPPEHLETIFEKFHQVDPNGSRDAAGTGLGLPITRELVTAHYGRIWAESEVGRGSRFIFTIPLLSEEEVFLRGLERDVDRARKLPAPLSLVIVEVKDLSSLKEKLGPQAYAELWQLIDETARRTIRRSTDRLEVRKEAGEVVAILLDTPREGARVFGRRVMESLTEAGEKAGIRLDFGCSTGLFPEDAATAERLYRWVQARIEEAVAGVRE